MVPMLGKFTLWKLLSHIEIRVLAINVMRATARIRRIVFFGDCKNAVNEFNFAFISDSSVSLFLHRHVFKIVAPAPV